MAPQRILLTGGAGFVGSHLRLALAARFPAARVLPTGEHEQPGIHRLDITDVAAARAVIGAFRPDAVIHLAAISAVTEANRDAERAWRVNLEGTRRLARAALEVAPDALFLFVSSAAVYGRSFRAGLAVAESAPLAPLDTYAATKAAAEMALSAMSGKGLRLVRLRPFNHIGPGQSESFAIGAFAAQIARIEAGLQPPELAVGSLAAERDFLDVRDVAAGYAAALEKAETLENGIALNLASGTARRIGAVLEELLSFARVPISVRTDTSRLRPVDLPRSVGCSALAERLLGWRPEIPWEKTLADLMADWRARIAAGEA